MLERGKCVPHAKYQLCSGDSCQKSVEAQFVNNDFDDMCLSSNSSKTSKFPMHDGHRARYYQFTKVFELREFMKR